jgi:hypothetical protein
MTFRRHRLGIVAAVFLLLTSGPLLTAVADAGTCGCSPPGGPCICCLQENGTSTDDDDFKASGVSKHRHVGDKRSPGRCHLRRGRCETSVPHPVVITSDTTAIGILEAVREDSLRPPMSLFVGPVDLQTDRDATGPEPPPPRASV